MKIIVIRSLCYWIAFCFVASSCEELVEVDPPKAGVPSETVFEDDVTAVAAISRLYYSMAYDCFWNITYPASLSADDLVGPSDLSRLQFYRNEILSTNSMIQASWSTGYKTIYIANSTIEGLKRSEKLTPDLKDQLMGEALFFRAFSHFYLVNLFGDVPYITSTDYRINGTVKRIPVSDVYHKIITDLVDARELLSEDYLYSKNERVRVNKWAAIAVLARTYLYSEDWARAEEQAGRVIERINLFKLEAPEDVFLKDSKEAIWQLIPTYPQAYTTEGSEFNKTYHDGSVSVLTEELISAIESNDKRKDEWIGYRNEGEDDWYYPLKYKETPSDTAGSDEYSMVLRLAEQYLIRAEARAKLDRPTDAAADLNIIRERAGLSPTTATMPLDLLAAIKQERRIEFFTEWGHRWLDLKRTGLVDEVLGVVKPDWDASDALYPIPYSELQRNPNLTQNLNY